MAVSSELKYRHLENSSDGPIGHIKNCVPGHKILVGDIVGNEAHKDKKPNQSDPPEHPPIKPENDILMTRRISSGANSGHRPLDKLGSKGPHGTIADGLTDDHEFSFVPPKFLGLLERPVQTPLIFLV
jgi:hypothetical protein